MSDTSLVAVQPDAVTQLLQINPYTGEIIMPSPDHSIVAAWMRVLTHRMLALPAEQQVKFKVEHTFLDGMYLRKLFIPKGSLLVGRVHKTECMNIVCEGDIAVLTESGSARVKAGYSVVSPAGIQKLGFAHEDTIFCNVFRTDETDVNKIEDALGDVPELRPYDEDVTDFCGFMREYGLSDSGVAAVVLDMRDHIDLPHDQQQVRFGPSDIHESGTFAMRDFAPGELVSNARIGNLRTLVGRLTNHSMQPNCIFADDLQGGIIMIAEKFIAKDSELTINYRQAARVNVSLGLRPLKELS